MRCHTQKIPDLLLISAINKQIQIHINKITVLDNNVSAEKIRAFAAMRQVLQT